MNKNIKSIDVNNEHFNNNLSIIVDIQGNSEKSISLPFSAMSDGTVKWVSLITAILTYRSVFAIEEPENFIHPSMQGEVLKIMRESVWQRRGGGGSFAILSTHSETLLNSAMPNEVIIVTMKNGITSAKRPKEASIIKREISQSGFGLGQIYLTGGLFDA